jgi:hypothetical protein
MEKSSEGRSGVDGRGLRFEIEDWQIANYKLQIAYSHFRRSQRPIAEAF